MNNKTLVRISNIIGIISIILLVYWVFTFILIEVFGLKVFRENMTETFYLSVIGILALMLGALIINIMFNLTRIAQKHNIDETQKPIAKKLIWSLMAIFPIIAILLFGGDFLTSQKKENLLIKSAKSIIETNESKSNKLIDYQFDEKYIIETSKTLALFSDTDKNVPSVTVIVKDTIDKSPVFLGFNEYYNGNLKDTISPKKIDFIQKTTEPERKYLNSVFNSNNSEIRYSSHDGNYELFYPYKKGNKKIILYFSDQQRYGKIGS